MTLYLKTLASGVYSWFVGRASVESVMEPRRFQQNFELKKPVNGKGTLFLKVFCFRIVHTVRFTRWYVPTSKYYSYKVEVYYVQGSDVTELPIAHYPQVTPVWLNDTNYPFLIAVTAYLDAIMKGESIGKPMPGV